MVAGRSQWLLELARWPHGIPHCSTHYRGGRRGDAMCCWRRSPAVLRVDVYATAALAGSLVMIASALQRTTATVGCAVRFTLRMLAVWQNWRLPTAGAL